MVVQGRLISFEGLDGVGKSTQLELLRASLLAQGHRVQCFREPGGTPAGEALRDLLKSGTFRTPLAELLAFSTARAELVELGIRPALARGEMVLLDRFTDSSLAYQGALGSLPIELIQRVNEIATSGLTPDLTLWLDLPVEQALKRRSAATDTGELDSIEQRNTDYFRRVRGIFAEICAAEPQRMQRIEVSGTPQEIAAVILSRLSSLVEVPHG